MKSQNVSSRRWRWLLLAVPAVVAVVVVLTVVPDRETSPSKGVLSGGPLGQPTVPPAEDRDRPAVLAALRQLDPCQLLDLELAKANGNATAATIPSGPHSCLLVPSPDHDPMYTDAEAIEVRVGTSSDQAQRYGGAPMTLGDAKAYRYESNLDYTSRCWAVIPVSFTLAIEVAYESDAGRDVCGILTPYVKAAVTRLREPDRLAMDHRTRTFSAWDGCTFLGVLVGRDGGDYEYEPHGLADPFSGCRTWQPKAMTSGPQFEVGYDDELPVPGGKPRRIGDTTVTLDELDDSCDAAWDNGPSGVRSRWFSRTMFQITAKDCATAVRLATRAIVLSGQQPPNADATPQRPLLYGPDDNDTGSLGACVHFTVAGGNKGCQPYQEVDVPADPAEIMTAGRTNPHLRCAVFKDAVATEFGGQFAPVVWDEWCYFVEPTHLLKIAVSINQFAPGDYGTGYDGYTDRQEITIAGKPAVAYWATDKDSFDIHLSPTGSLTQPGQLTIGLRAGYERGKDSLDEQPTLDPPAAEHAKRAMAQVVQAYFA